MKPGWKSTEFAMAIVGALLPVINKYFELDLPEDSIYAILAYIIGRSGVKIAEARRLNG